MAWAAACLCAAGVFPVQAAEPPAAAANTPAPGTLRLRLDTQLAAPGRGAASADRPAIVRAERIQVQPGDSLLAEGQVEFRRAGAVLRADRVSYRVADDQVHAQGQVRISRDGVIYSGPELQVQLERFEGWFAQPRFDLQRIGAGGTAERIEFRDAEHARAWQARYTSCPRDDGTTPDWQLSMRRLDLDLAANEGVAEGAVLRFLGVPILAAPTLSFPVTNERKSGWLPPNVNLDNRSGLDLSVPYYWNIAPNRDATLTPRILARRGVGGEAEFRYLEPRHAGTLTLDAIPNDRVAGRARWALRAEHASDWPVDEGWLAGARLSWKGVRVSDDDWWKDFPRQTTSLTPRLLSQAGGLERPLRLGPLQGTLYGRLSHWQVLQSTDAIQSPYQRSPQLGLRLQADAWHGLEGALETEFNRFTLPTDAGATAGRPTGSRWHGIAQVSRPWRGTGWWLTPSASLHATVYDTDGRGGASRVLPTVSVDAGAVFERRTQLFGQPLRQVLEPRLHYVRTPYRDQSGLPNYDSAGKDFNITSIYADNAWSGIDRVSDSHQLTLGATTRLVRDSDGAEVLRLGLVQRLLLDPERVTPDDSQPTQQAAAPLSRKLSDVLLLGSTQLVPRWTFEGTIRFNADTQRAVRSVMSARYSTSDFRAVSASYRYTRGQAEQIDIGWQWPLTAAARGPAASGSGCGGRLYGVGRLNYSMLDSRITDSLLGLEYDAGCWIGRVVAERVSTGRSEATTRLMLQLELIGLSRLGSNPLRVLKDNIPGYRLLRDEPADPPASSTFHE